MQRTEAAWETDSDQFHSFPSSPEFTVRKTVLNPQNLASLNGSQRTWFSGLEFPCMKEKGNPTILSYIDNNRFQTETNGILGLSSIFKEMSILSELSAFLGLCFPNCDVVRMMKHDLTGTSAVIQKVIWLATDGPEHKICQRGSTKGWGCWECESGQLTMMCLWLSRRLSWRELPTLQRPSTVSLATTTSSQPLLTLQFMQGWWAWTPSVDNWLWMSLRHHKPPIKVRRLLFPSLPFPLPLDKLIFPPFLPLPFTGDQIYIYLHLNKIYLIKYFFFQKRFFTCIEYYCRILFLVSHLWT